MNKRLILLSLLLATLAAFPAAAAWTPVGDGITYQEFVLPDPNRLFVTRLERSNLNATIETSLPQGRISGGGREVVSGMAARYDGALSYWGGEWGATNDVVVAVNGDFWNTSTGVPWGGLFHSGWLAKLIYTWWGGAQFSWTMNRVAFISGCVETSVHSLNVGFAGTDQTMTADAVNYARDDSNDFVIYTPQWASTTGTDNSGVEVQVQLTSPLLALTPAESVSGHVREIRQSQGSTFIPFDHIVLSAQGAAATELLSHVGLGSEVKLSIQVTTADGLCQMPMSAKWKNTFSSIHGNAVMLNNGMLPHEWDTNRHPRTAIAYDENYVYFVVCDGRSTISRGMTGTELAAFCRNTLRAKWGINIDGGGSSTMVVNGSVKNTPSDGHERAVANGIMMVNVLPRTTSSALCVGQYVTTGNANIRLGPGTNYGALSLLSSGTLGYIIQHPLNGIAAKGYSWWHVRTAQHDGWIAESLLTPFGELEPLVAQDPVAQVLCEESDASFSVIGRGSGCLEYRWLKDGVDLSDDGHYVGADTPSLRVVHAVVDDNGLYRCRISSPYGTTISAAASLTVRPETSVAIGNPSVAATQSGPVTFSVIYLGADSVSLSPADITLFRTGTADVSTITVKGSAAISRTVTLSGITGEGTLSIAVAAGTAEGCTVAPAAGPSAAVVVDNTAPDPVSVFDQGTWTPSVTTLSASWSPAEDAGSGIGFYQYALGTSPSLADVRPFESVGVSTSSAASGLSLQEGQVYYFLVRPVDRAGNIGPISASDGITCAPSAGSIGALWSHPDSVPVALRAKPVTASFVDAFWLEEPDRSAAIKVASTAAPAVGDCVSVAGVLGLSGAQRALWGDVVEMLGPCQPVRPLGISAHRLGGISANAATPGATGSSALYNVGMLVRVWGKVISHATGEEGSNWFLLDDGSSPPFVQGVRVRCGSTDPPTAGFVEVTGVVTLEEHEGQLVPVVLLRSPADIRPR